MVDVETFRALARSSPWLWSSVRLTRTIVGRDDGEQVRAWIRRPGRMRVEYLEPSKRPPYVVDERRSAGRGRSLMVSMRSGQGEDEGGVEGDGYMPLVYADDVPDTPDEAPPADVHAPQDPEAPQPVWRADGLVARRADDFMVSYDDPMHVNYYWVAMLDPRELADGADPDEPPERNAVRPVGVDVLDLEETERHGRPTVVATVRPAPTYDPRCSCCALLYNDVTVAILQEEGGPVPEPMPRFADAHRVALDRQTGICVSIRDIGGDADGEGYEVEEVDAAYPETLFR
ncbi:hypothetical protein [Phytoactinopolyspora halotolerans]|uniref:Uncharacterized protein n=1 Tax=Phytoactinopolyspora halotolerans TaxID=1981512 RepID=A0A6L9S3B7_9ACTN|nr:hypothetical protein [Phytoactinopolyspora halotolerans]NED99552.1 hypothetical protein [Phytoactinopolyspora halotolerans]